MRQGKGRGAGPANHVVNGPQHAYARALLQVATSIELARASDKEE